MSTFLEIRDLAKSFGDHRVLDGLSLELAEGEILALLGLSGSGKTTALRLLAGFENPDEGSIQVAGDDVVRLPPARRGFGMVFQHYALFPHMTVAENVAFGLESQGWSIDRRAGRIDEMLELVDLAGFGGRRVSEISGGQQQRVALARALAPEPRILLLDEPLSNLDPSLRERTREELRAAVRRIGITTVLVTHEQEEAFHVGDRVAVLHGGKLQQLGAPEDLYHRPASRFVATFVGRSSVVSATLDSLTPRSDGVGFDGRASIATPGGAVSWAVHCPQELGAGSPIDLVVKPESLELVSNGGDRVLPARGVENRFTGALTYCRVRLDVDEGTEGPVIEVLVAGAGTAAVDGPKAGSSVGEEVFVALRPGGPIPRAFARDPG